ncbi:hypothetical protein [Carp edema virus]|nr:hypothetical protein [Carp edema virus]
MCELTDQDFMIMEFVLRDYSYNKVYAFFAHHFRMKPLTKSYCKAKKSDDYYRKHHFVSCDDMTLSDSEDEDIMSGPVHPKVSVLKQEELFVSNYTLSEEDLNEMLKKINRYNKNSKKLRCKILKHVTNYGMLDVSEDLL